MVYKMQKKPHFVQTKSRINVTIGPGLHDASRRYAEDREMSFSELIAYLLRRELSSPSIPSIEKPNNEEHLMNNVQTQDI